jgi:16S rRNA (uracil1498-N3)-methyltransferase
VPEIDPPAPLLSVLDRFEGQEAGRRLVFCDEGHGGADPLAILAAIPPGPLAVLVGPEGGFAEEERSDLLLRPFVSALPLGPRILRADTAAVAALALVQAASGDWRRP